MPILQQTHIYPGMQAISASGAEAGFTPRTEALLSVSAIEAAAVEQLGAFFPELPPSELRAVLERVSWDVNTAAGDLIDLGLGASV